ncbi:hypothetical protein LF1_08080 [Rubripirellula obstinata]|uniref:Uncharacterized protein n=1 Tax=Rubripirellula obstinata TaxID=406547 RepID=A0A5B1CDJ8_9BACT|nr:hypothetical protein LF1_08080 [Rubripirellula obstinata]
MLLPSCHDAIVGHVGDISKHGKTLQITAGIGLLRLETHGSCVSSKDGFSFTQTERQT